MNPSRQLGVSSGDPFQSIQNLLEQQMLEQQIQTQRLVPGRGSVSVIQRSTTINGAKVSYTLTISSDEIE